MDHEPDDPDRRGVTRRLARRLREQIDSGAYPVGAALPSYRSLMTEHGIALNTAQAVIRLLEQEGRVTIRHGRGAYVIDRPSPVPPEVQLRELRSELHDLRDQIRDAGGAFTTLEQHVTTLIDRLDGTQP
jgi:DNA-binding GntR family transcriptional regulator